MVQRTLVVDSGGTTRLIKSDRFFVVDSGGVTRKLKRLFVVDSGGVARQVYQAAVFALPATSVDNQSDPNPATAQVVFNTDGTYTSTGTAGGNWITPTSLAPGAYTIRASVLAGSTPSGSALDTDLALSTQRSWLITQSGPGSTVCSLQLTIKDGGGNIMLQQTCEMEANVDV